ncbi:MAG: radical SAM family heme chaperone HemW [Phycisphaerales bacterium]|nr:radical SAM family heme chaperone HemW [Phycisphaerales bacterium]
MSEIVRSIYAHVPFCHTICGYCDFYSEVLDRNAVTPLVDALIAELDAYAVATSIAADTIFVGGGTPTTLPAVELRRLLTRLAQCANSEASLEFTSEANPATVTPEIADALVAGGVNRVSIGAQSFDKSELRVLERIHHPPQVAQTVATCRAAGVDAISLDLIFGVPGQSMNAWLSNLQAALALEPDHLSCYGLTYERGTPLFDQLATGVVTRVESELEAEMFEATIDTLAAHGFDQYEISNFAKPGRECRHNLRYWRNEPYLGIGPSAAGFVDGVRYKNVPDTAAYVRASRLGQSARISEERLDAAARSRETMMLELRLREGVARGRFADRFGADPAALFRDAINRHLSLGLLEVDAGAVRLTRAGQLVADSVIADFI